MRLQQLDFIRKTLLDARDASGADLKLGNRCGSAALLIEEEMATVQLDQNVAAIIDRPPYAVLRPSLGVAS